MKTLRKMLASLTPSLILASLLISLLGGAIAATPARAATILVTINTDEYGPVGAGCSLREAIQAANTNAAFGGCPAGSPGLDIISLSSATYQLTIANAGGINEDANATGDLDILETLTINGLGVGSTFIQAGTDSTNGIDKVIAANPLCTPGVNISIDGVTIRYGRNTQAFGAVDVSYTGGGMDYCAGSNGSTFTMSNSAISNNTNVNGYGGGLNLDSFNAPSYTINLTNVTFSSNRTLSTVNEANGGAVNIFGDQVTANITGSTFTGNTTANVNSAGGAIHFRTSALAVGPTSSLNISASTFSSNIAAGNGGAVATNTFGTGTTVSIQNSSFTGNTATNSFGGALYLSGSVATATPFSLTHLTITGNTAGSEGGGVYVGNSNVIMSKSFIVGNSAPTASGLRKNSDVATATVTNNWWGCSAGPGAAPCDTVSTAGGTLTSSPWYRNQLTAAISPLVTNQSTSLTASFLTNSAGSAVPAADVSEIVGKSVTWAASSGSLSGTQSTVQAAGTATGTFQPAGVGSVTISAKVSNDNTAPVSSNVLSLTVNKANTTTAITSDTPDASVTGQTVTVFYTVTGQYGNSPTAPTGNVTVSDGADSCTATAAAGQCTITFRTAGAKALTASYVGDSNFNASTSASETHTVNKANTTTTITSDTPDPSDPGQTVTFNVSVAAVSPGAAVSPTTITGSVTVSDGGSNSCIATLTAGAGSCTISLPDAGAYTMNGSYSGDSNFNTSVSSAVSHTVNGYSTTTSITSDLPDFSVVGQAVTVQYSVTTSSGALTGNVTVSDGVDSCVGAAAAGQCVITFTSAGFKSLTATYAGDANHNGSVSAAEGHQVNAASTTTSITSDSPDPSAAGQSVTVNYTVSVTAPGAGVPTGNVVVSDGVDSCIGTVAAGACNLTLTTNGARTLTATYAGDANFNGSVSAGKPHTVDGTAPTVTIEQANGQSDPTAVSPINFTVVFSESVTGFGANDLTLSGTAGATTAVVTGGPTSYNVAVSGMSVNGTVIARVKANAAVDAVGNTNTVSTSVDNKVNFLADVDAPETSIDSHPANPSNTGSAAFTFSGSDNVTPPGSLVFECQLDGSGFSTCSSPKNYSNLGVGSHTFDVRARDAAGNVDATPATFTWERLAAPSVSVMNGTCSAPSDPTGKLNLRLFDPQGDPLTLSVVSISNTTLVPYSNVKITGLGSIRSLIITGAPGMSGTSKITLGLNDGNATTLVSIMFKVGGAGNDALSGTTGIDILVGMAGNDSLNGGASSDLLCGGSGNDSLNGGAGNDTLEGGFGDDTLLGGPGNDVLSGMAGEDTMTGNAGADSFVGGPGLDVLADFNPSEGDTKHWSSP